MIRSFVEREVRGRLGRSGALAGAARVFGATLIVASIALSVPPAVATAAAPDPTDSSCGYADPDGGGKFPSSICWLDFSGLDASSATAQGQDFAMSLGMYDVTFNVVQQGVPEAGWTLRAAEAAAATAPPFVLGAAGYYHGIPGKPFLYSSTGSPFGGVTIAIRNVQISLDGKLVDNYDLISAAPETQDAQVGAFGEWLHWTSDKPLSLIDHTTPFNTGGGCALPPAGVGTADVWCNPGAAGSESAFGSIFAARSATSMSGSVYLSSRGEREALAFGIRTARVSLEKQLTDRLDPRDDFSVTVTSHEGPVLATATTGSSSTASTGLVPVIPSGPITLAEVLGESSASELSYYSQSWKCTNAADGSTTDLPSGSGTTKAVELAPGDAVDCIVKNTPRPATVSLSKTASPETGKVGETVTYSYKVTNTGELPLDTLTIKETSFTGSGSLSPITCPETSLAPDHSITCTATYVLTQHDVDQGGVVNQATAGMQVAHTSSAVVSQESEATVTSVGEGALTVSKSVDTSSAQVGDSIHFTLKAQNTGTLTLHEVTLEDTGFTGSGDLGNLDCDRSAPVTLSPGEVLTCTASYQVKAADVGSVVNHAEGTGLDPSGQPLAGTDQVTLEVASGSSGGGLAFTGADGWQYYAGGSLLAMSLGLILMGVSRRRRA